MFCQKWFTSSTCLTGTILVPLMRRSQFSLLVLSIRITTREMIYRSILMMIVKRRKTNIIGDLKKVFHQLGIITKSGPTTRLLNMEQPPLQTTSVENYKHHLERLNAIKRTVMLWPILTRLRASIRTHIWQSSKLDQVVSYSIWLVLCTHLWGSRLLLRTTSTQQSILSKRKVSWVQILWMQPCWLSQTQLLRVLLSWIVFSSVCPILVFKLLSNSVLFQL